VRPLLLLGKRNQADITTMPQRHGHEGPQKY
jgi:hypothetical protein